MEQEIVVVGRRQVAGDGTLSTFYVHNISTNQWSRMTRQAAGGYTQEPLATAPTDVAEDGADESDQVATVITGPNLANAQAAAANLLYTLNRVELALRQAAPGVLIATAGRTMTAAQLLELIEETEFVITDQTFNNGGVGEAERLSNGETRIRWNYAAFDGDLSNNQGNDYAHPNYSNNQGMTAILLHDLGHITPEGGEFNRQTRIWWDKALNDGYLSPRVVAANNPFWLNNEAMANNFAQSAASGTGLDISGWGQTQGTNWTSPQSIYSQLANP